MKTLNVPIINLTELKTSPGSAFDLARESNSGVYVFKNNKPYGVVLTVEQYEGLHSEIDGLYEKIDEFSLRERLADTDLKTYTEKEVLGDRLKDVTYDENDGWK